jgi:hypothetical protein|tara:strand:- start:1353 stop:1847 length:495 start_codon:yes stop_codon:yes gene_type:complete
MDLLTISDKKVIPNAYTLTIKDFKNLKSADLAAIYYFTDHRSPYAVYPLEDRKAKIVHDLGVKWSPQLDVGVKKYKELTETSAVKLLKAARSSIGKLERYFQDIDLTLMDDNGKPIYAAKDLVANLTKMGDVVSGLTKLEDVVKKDQQAAAVNRGGVVVNKYSQ